MEEQAAQSNEGDAQQLGQFDPRNEVPVHLADPELRQKLGPILFFLVSRPLWLSGALLWAPVIALSVALIIVGVRAPNPCDISARYAVIMGAVMLAGLAVVTAITAALFLFRCPCCRSRDPVLNGLQLSTAVFMGYIVVLLVLGGVAVYHLSSACPDKHRIAIQVLVTIATNAWSVVLMWLFLFQWTLLTSPV